MIDKDKQIVEKDWINMYDSIEPLNKPLRNIESVKRNRARYIEYNHRDYVRAKKKEEDKKRYEEKKYGGV